MLVKYSLSYSCIVCQDDNQDDLHTQRLRMEHEELEQSYNELQLDYNSLQSENVCNIISRLVI